MRHLTEEDQQALANLAQSWLIAEAMAVANEQRAKEATELATTLRNSQTQMHAKFNALLGDLDVAESLVIPAANMVIGAHNAAVVVTALSKDALSFRKISLMQKPKERGVVEISVGENTSAPAATAISLSPAATTELSQPVAPSGRPACYPGPETPK